VGAEPSFNFGSGQKPRLRPAPASLPYTQLLTTSIMYNTQKLDPTPSCYRLPKGRCIRKFENVRIQLGIVGFFCPHNGEAKLTISFSSQEEKINEIIAEGGGNIVKMEVRIVFY